MDRRPLNGNELELGPTALMRFGNTSLGLYIEYGLPQQSVREQSHHVVLVGGQVASLMDGNREIIPEVTPVAQIAHPLRSAKRQTEVHKHRARHSSNS